MSSGGGSKKNNTRMMSSSVSMSLYQEPSSPSSIYLPPLLDSSPYAAAAAANDRDCCSYDGSSTTPREHVSCFSTFSAAANYNNNLPNVSYELSLPPPPPPAVSAVAALDPFARFQNNVGVPVFPSLRSLQENLHLPFLPPATAHGGSGGDMAAWVKPEEQTVVCGGGGGGMTLCHSELDYMWGGGY